MNKQPRKPPSSSNKKGAHNSKTKLTSKKIDKKSTSGTDASLALAKKKNPDQTKAKTSNEKGAEDLVLSEKLDEVRVKLARSFSSTFVESLCYFIECEHQSQVQLEIAFHNLNWNRLDYFLQQLKKICKQKQHLVMLFGKIQLYSFEASFTTKSLQAPSSAKPGSADLKSQASMQLELKRPKDDLLNRSEDNFSLIRIIIRFLSKLFKFNCYDLQKCSKSVHDDEKQFNLELVMLSCLADICFYEEMRIQVVSDSNIQCLFNLFTVMTNLEFDSREGSFRRIKKYWSKMCRLSANLCQDGHLLSLNDLFTKEFMLNISQCLEKQSQLLQATTLFNDIESNANDLDLFHSLIRFIKYGYRLSKCKLLFLETRLLVYVCRIMYRYNKNLTFSMEESFASDRASGNKADPSDNKSEGDRKILINKKSHSLCRELIKHYLILLDDWPHPIGCEFYNQIIESHVLEHLIWLQIDDKTEQMSVTSMPMECKAAENNSSVMAQAPKKSEFDYSEFSFNLLLKLCHDYHACRAEFGRVGGLAKYLKKIELTNTAMDKDSNKKLAQRNEKLIEMICFCCKESVNRLRLKEQAYLGTLVKLQQNLKCKYVRCMQQVDNQSEQALCSDSTIHNKLLVAICCFAHDQDSMNTLFANGLIDSLLGFLNDSIVLEKRIKENSKDTKEPADCSITSTSDFSVFKNEAEEKKTINLNSLLNTQDTRLTISANTSTSGDQTHCLKKRKASDSSLTVGGLASNSLQSKRCKLGSFGTTGTQSEQVFMLPQVKIGSFVSTDSNPNNSGAEWEHHYAHTQCSQNMPSTSPDSYCSLSPTSNPFSPSFSPSSPSNYRCNSANMFSPSPSFNDMSSPKFNWQNSEDHPTNIQFSPTIDRHDSSDEMAVEETEKKDLHEIMGSDMLKSDYEDVMETDETTKDDDVIVLDKEDGARGKNECSHDDSIRFSLDSSCTDESTGGSSFVELPNTHKHTDLKTTESIEAIHRTEACVFYVLSQLSHGDRPSMYLINNFEVITTCLLNYLKYAQVRNPRALRILNRLTKNHYCFYTLVMIRFPYKLKSILFERNDRVLRIKKAVNARCTSKSQLFAGTKKMTTSSSCNDLDKMKFKTNSPCLYSNKSYSASEEDIEKEMSVYLNSNKAFFDARTFFPSFDSVEFTLVNNLKMQCISSSDHGYLCLVSMMKSSQKRHERLACALVAPFILRNSKALQNIMVHLGGIDLILDVILPVSPMEESPANSLADSKKTLYENALLCINKILAFVGYKYDSDRCKQAFHTTRQRFCQTQSGPIDLNAKAHSGPGASATLNRRVTFVFNEDSRSIDVNSDVLAGRSEYFSALLCGHFMEAQHTSASTPKAIPIQDISYEAFTIIVSLIENSASESLSASGELSVCVGVELCIEIILASDRLFLTDLKELFISIILYQFLNLSTCFILFRLAWYLGCSALESACIDFFLHKLNTVSEKPAPKKVEFEAMAAETEPNSASHEEYEKLDDITKCSMLVDYAKDSFKPYAHRSCIETTQSDELSICEHFKKGLKSVLSEIIRK